MFPRSNEVFRVKLDEYVCKLAWDSNDSLWAMTGKQQLYKLDSARNRHNLVGDSCKHFSLCGDCIAYVTCSDKIVVRSTSDFAEITSLQSDTRVHRICLQNDSIIIASNSGLIAWDLGMHKCKIIKPKPIVAMDMCHFGPTGNYIIAEWSLYCLNLRTGYLQMLQSREYDVEYPFYGLATFKEEYLSISASSLEILDCNLKQVAFSPDIRAVESVFIDADTLVVREGGHQKRTANLSEAWVPSKAPHHNKFHVFIVTDADALAFSESAKHLAIASKGFLSVIQTKELRIE